MPASKLKEFLDSHQVEYTVINHAPAYAAHEIAACAQIPAKELAKTVIVKVGDRLVMAVLPASYKIDLDLLRRALDVKQIELAAEEEFEEAFPGCALGAMPPFGNLFGMDVFVAQTLTDNEQIAFNAGSHTQLIKMAYRDFARLVKPKELRFSAR